MAHTTTRTPAPAVVHIQRMLGKIDRLRLPARSRRDVECILIRQVAEELDRAVPSHAGHGTRTAHIARLIGLELALDPEALHHLRLAAYLHDIGLLLLPPTLAHSTGLLDSESYRTVQCHAKLGGQFLEPFAFLHQASVIVAHHHERWDGSGYPFGIRGRFIPLEARILSVADTFDAIDVPGADSRDVRDHVACRIIRAASGTQFDPSLAGTLEQILWKRESTRKTVQIDE